MKLLGNAHHRYVYGQKTTACLEKYPLPTGKYGGESLMCFGGFAASGPGYLVKNNGIMNCTKYQDT